MQIACGRCTGCRLERSRLWAARCMHESLEHEESYFVTFTYNDDSLPDSNSLRPRDLTLFFKRLRKAGHHFRYFACGEYGDKGRPHYHAIIFGLRLPDLKYTSTSYSGSRLYKSELLQKHWYHEKTGNSLGFLDVGHCTFESCAYVARYILKKQLGNSALRLWRDPKTDKFYDKETGEQFFGQIPEYVVMSRNPGIGANFVEKYKREIYGPGNDGSITMRDGIRFGTPRFYDTRFEKINPDLIKSIREQRRLKAEESKVTSLNRHARVTRRNQKITLLKRNLE